MRWRSCVNDGARYGNDETIAVVRVRDDHQAAAVIDARALYDLFYRRSGAAGLCRRVQGKKRAQLLALRCTAARC